MRRNRRDDRKKRRKREETATRRFTSNLLRPAGLLRKPAGFRTFLQGGAADLRSLRSGTSRFPNPPGQGFALDPGPRRAGDRFGPRTPSARIEPGSDGMATEGTQKTEGARDTPRAPRRLRPTPPRLVGLAKPHITRVPRLTATRGRTWVTKGYLRLRAR